MATVRSNLPLRLRQLLSGESAVGPSLKLESEPPPKIKAFIDRVIKSPLHDIGIPLSAFRWEYSKGNFHHWRPLFLHFDTYFKTYLCCRKELLLSDDMTDDSGSFPKNTMMQILRVMQIILDNCPNKSSFSGLEHFKLLLASTDPDIVIAALETLSALVRINPSKLHVSGKLIGCGSFNSCLLSLAQGWGSKEEGLGLSSCVMANEKSQEEGFCLFPSDTNNGFDKSQFLLGSTLHFEFHVAPQDSSPSNEKMLSSNLRVIHIPDLNLQEDDDISLLKKCVEQYGVPLEHRFSLLTRIRYARAFCSPTGRLYSKICLLAFIVLVQSGDAHDELASFFANEPEYTNELMDLVRSENSVPGTIRTLAMLALVAQLAAYSSSHDRDRILSGSSVIAAGGNRMVLLSVLQRAVLTLNNRDPSSYSFVSAILHFYLLHVISSSSSGSTIRGSGMVPTLLPLLQDSEFCHSDLICSAVKTLQKLMDYSNAAVSLFKDLGGVELLAWRLDIEVHRVVGMVAKNDSSMVIGDAYESDDENLYSQKRLIKVLLKALGSATYAPTNSTRSQNSLDSSLPASLSLIFQNVKRFGGDIYFSAVTLMSEIIHKDPTCFPILHDLGLPSAFLSSVSAGILPFSKALACVPNGLGAICLNTKGLEAVKEMDALKFLVEIFTTRKYLIAMNEGVVSLANAVEELLRHVSSLRSVGVDIIIEIIEKLASMGDDLCVEPFGKVEGSTVMETDLDDIEGKSLDPSVISEESTSTRISNERFVRLCIFHVMVLVHRVLENTEACRLFVEKKGIEALMKLLLRPGIAQSSEGMSIALHSTGIFKVFAQYHSAPLAQAFCSCLRVYLKKALSGFASSSETLLLVPSNMPDSKIFSPLFVIEFLLILPASKDSRWMNALLTEFGNGSRDVLEDIGQVHREVLWQTSLLDGLKNEVGEERSGSGSIGEPHNSDVGANETEGQRFNSFRQLLDPLLRRRVSGWSVESQFYDLINLYRELGRSSGVQQRLSVDGTLNQHTGSSDQVSRSSPSDAVSSAEGEKQNSYHSSCCDMMRSLCFHISHLCLELGKSMLNPSRRQVSAVSLSSTSKSVASKIGSIVLDHLNFRGHVDPSNSDSSISTKCRFLGKVVDFVDSILLERPESFNPVFVNCFYVCGVVDSVLTTFEATSQLLSAVNRPPTSPMEMDDWNPRPVEDNETDHLWLYGALSSYGKLMDHLVTSSFILLPSTKHLLTQSVTTGNVQLPRDAETFVKVLQSKVLKAVLPVWTHPHFVECSYEFIASVIAIMRHVFAGVQVKDANNIGARITGPPPDESAISMIVEMGFSRSRAEEALQQVGTNSVEMAMEWLFSHPEEAQEDDELSRALAMSLGSSVTSVKEDATGTENNSNEILEAAQLPPVDELISACTKLLQMKESLAFPVRDLLVLISSHNNGEHRQKIITHFISHLKASGSIVNANNETVFFTIFHVLALIFQEDSVSREIAAKNGLAKIVLDLLSQWDQVVCNGDNYQVPKWVTSSFLAIDCMLLVDSKLNPETLAAELSRKNSKKGQVAVVVDEDKTNNLQCCLGFSHHIDADEQKKLIEIACRCICDQLPSETMHGVLQLCATLTKNYSNALSFLEMGGLNALFCLPTTSLFPGFDSITAVIVRHILEDPQTLQQAMETEIRHSVLEATNRHSTGRLTPRSFLQNLAPVISRDPLIFMQAAKSVCQVEMVGERPQVVLLKDREKEKLKEKEKDNLQTGDDKTGSGNVCCGKVLDSNTKNVKVHRKLPHSFTSTIDLLLDYVISFEPSQKVGLVDGAVDTSSMVDMEIDGGTASKGKGKAIATASQESKPDNQEPSAALAKAVFILKLLTKILLTYASSIHVLLRRDAEVGSGRARPQRGPLGKCNVGVFHHVLHEFVPYSERYKKDKKADGDWRQKLVNRASQFLVASSIRSSEARKRVFTEISTVFNNFVDSSDVSKSPNFHIHAYVDLLNDIFAARSPTGSSISSEASATFIDVGLVQSLTGMLKVLDLDHVDSPKIVTGIVKVLELVSKEHLHSADTNAGKASGKSPFEPNQSGRADNSSNRFEPLEAASQPDHNEGGSGHIVHSSATQSSISSDSGTDDMEQDGNLDGPFAAGAEDDYMHELSEEVGSAENGIATVEIRFDIPHDGQHNLVEDNDDDDDDGRDEEEDDMSGDEVDEDDDQDEDEEDDDDGDDDEENNDLEEDEVHDMSHLDMVEDDHEVDEDVFNEDGFDEEDDGDEDDDEGVILQLEEGINGINVLDQIEVFSRDYNFVNDTFRVMPVDVFGSRRQGRTTSIYNLIGRNVDHGSPLQHPLLAEPSSLGTLMPRQSGDPGFLDMNSENNSSRLDSIFQSLRSGRHGHRFNMWVDESHQRSGSNVPTIPAGMEELLVSQLRRPTPDQPSQQDVASMQTQDKGEDGQLQGSEADSREETQVENNANNGSEAIHSPNLPVLVATGNADIRLEDDQEGRDGSNSDMQAINLPYERNDAAVRDMEAVSQASSGSGATLGESLRSLEVEIGSADGHDDGGERQASNERPSGDLHASRTRRGSAAHFSRDTSLQSVSEVMPHPPQESQSAPAEERQNSQAVNSGPIDPAFLDALPEELRVEVLSTQQNQVVQLPNEQPQSAGDIDPEFLAALPPDIREEVLSQQRVQRINQSQELEGQPVEMDTVSIIATFPSELREEVLLTSQDAILANLTPALVAEANMLRERYAHRYQNSTLLSMYPQYRRGESSRRADAVGSSFDRATGNGGSRRSLGGKVIEADGAPLVDNDALKAMIRLFHVVQPLYKGQFQRLLLNLCAHCETRTTLMHILMDMLMLDVCGPNKSISPEESFHRLYACKSYVMYSRPQFSNGIPPLVSRRILETMTYLARNHPNVAKFLLRLELPRLYLQESSPDQGHGKSVMVTNGEETERQHQNEEYSVVLLLSLLNQPLYLRSIAHLEQLLNLLEVIINTEGVPRVSNNTDAIHAGEPSGSDGATQDANVNSDTTESAMSDVKSSGAVNGAGTSTAGVSKECDVLSILLRLPKPELRLLCSLLAREGLSESVYSLVAEIMKKLVAIAPAHRHLFISELAASVENLTKFALNELCGCMEVDKELSTSSTNGTAILRVLQALSSLVVSLPEKDKDLLALQEEYDDTLSQVSDINAHLEPLWLELSVCISKIETCSDSAPGLSSTSGSLASSSTGSVAPLSAGSQNILPYVESFFVTCEKLRPWQSNAANDFITTEVEEATTSTGVQKPSSSGHAKTDDKYIPFVKFSEKHRKLLNSFIRQNPGLLEKSLSLMLKVPRFIDFDNKRAYFRSKIKHQHDHHHNPLRISVRRAYILEDSYNQLRLRLTEDLKGRLTVHFQGEEGIDAGGLTREWYQLLSRVIFDKGALLFTTVGNESTFQPNPNSGYQTEHLSYFKFVGRVVGKALFDGQLLDVHFTRSFYKHILGVKVTYHDIEAIDPDYFKNLKWLLENDISDIIDLTFSIDADEEKLILYERTEVTDHELITGGRNIRVTEENKHEYVDLVAEHRLTTAIRPQINAFMDGFNELIHRDLISIFNDRELELLISGLPEIDLDDLRVNSEYSGYSSASPVIQWFWEVVQGFSKEDKARLLQFVTGTSKVPLEGFSALQGISGPQKFQIHKAYGSPDHLPSAHTCFNQLDLPEYPSKERLQERLLLAIHEGNEGFGFG